jgi:hypothetical protein
MATATSLAPLAPSETQPPEIVTPALPAALPVLVRYNVLPASRDDILTDIPAQRLAVVLEPSLMRQRRLVTPV